MSICLDWLVINIYRPRLTVPIRLLHPPMPASSCRALKVHPTLIVVKIPALVTLHTALMQSYTFKLIACLPTQNSKVNQYHQKKVDALTFACKLLGSTIVGLSCCFFGEAALVPFFELPKSALEAPEIQRVVSKSQFSLNSCIMPTLKNLSALIQNSALIPSPNTGPEPGSQPTPHEHQTWHRLPPLSRVQSSQSPAPEESYNRNQKFKYLLTHPWQQCLLKEKRSVPTINAMA